MANREHVQVALEGKNAIAQWRSRNPDVRLDLVAAELDGIDLRMANLSNADLGTAKLTGANLSLVVSFQQGCMKS